MRDVCDSPGWLVPGLVFSILVIIFRRFLASFEIYNFRMGYFKWGDVGKPDPPDMAAALEMGFVLLGSTGAIVCTLLLIVKLLGVS